MTLNEDVCRYISKISEQLTNEIILRYTPECDIFNTNLLKEILQKFTEIGIQIKEDTINKKHENYCTTENHILSHIPLFKELPELYERISFYHNNLELMIYDQYKKTTPWVIVFPTIGNPKSDKAIMSIIAPDTAQLISIRISIIQIVHPQKPQFAVVISSGKTIKQKLCDILYLSRDANCAWILYNVWKYVYDHSLNRIGQCFTPDFTMRYVFGCIDDISHTDLVEYLQ